MKAKVNWISKFHLEGETESGHIVQMDTGSVDSMTKGPHPKELLLQSIAGCTMLDVISILEKSRKHIEKFWIDVDSSVCKEIPKTFKKISLCYNFVGDDLNASVIEQSINTSMDKYSSIHKIFKNSVEIKTSFKIYSVLEFIDHVYEDAEKHPGKILV
jgi:putative redox protein